MASHYGAQGMGNSLRDELLKAGLVSEERLEKPRHAKRAKAGPGKKHKASPAPPPSEPSAAAPRHVLRENQRRTARFVRDSTLGAGSVAESAKKALRRKIQEHVEKERLNDAHADVAYHFIKGKRIKRIYVTQAQRADLGTGAIVVAALDGNHHLMSQSAAAELLALAPHTVVCSGASSGAESEEHPVPDDIVW
jgi:uncharacterized protein YaiL (DUF2058 family)